MLSVLLDYFYILTIASAELNQFTGMLACRGNAGSNYSSRYDANLLELDGQSGSALKAVISRLRVLLAETCLWPQALALFFASTQFRTIFELVSVKKFSPKVRTWHMLNLYWCVNLM
jgi:hypothetical protein